jgi:hypothetical protein
MCLVSASARLLEIFFSVLPSLVADGIRIGLSAVGAHTTPWHTPNRGGRGPNGDGRGGATKKNRLTTGDGVIPLRST